MSHRRACAGGPESPRQSRGGLQLSLLWAECGVGDFHPISSDFASEDGGTRVVPGFQHSFMQWLQSLGEVEPQGPYCNYIQYNVTLNPAPIVKTPTLWLSMAAVSRSHGGQPFSKRPA